MPHTRKVVIADSVAELPDDQARAMVRSRSEVDYLEVRQHQAAKTATKAEKEPEETAKAKDAEKATKAEKKPKEKKGK